MPVYIEPYQPIGFIIRGQWRHQYIYRRRSWLNNYCGRRTVACQERLNYYYPYDPRNPNVLNIRQYFYNAQRKWEVFDIPTQQFYNSKADRYNMTGKNRYFQFYFRAIYNK